MSDDATSAKREILRNRHPALRLINGPQQGQSKGILAGRARSWLCVAVLAFVGICGLVFMHRLTDATSKDSTPRKETRDLARELHSLTQSDLIQFADGRIWYVRSVRGENMEIVGWIGDNTKIEFIPSFVLSSDQFRIIRKSDSAWPSTRDKYLDQ